MQALNEIIKMYECEVAPDNFVIHLRKKIRADNGLHYRLKKNIVSSSFKDDGASWVTKLSERPLLKQEQPTLEVSISTADLFKIDNTEPRPHLGDTVACIDPEMNLNKIKARIIDLVELPYAPR